MGCVFRRPADRLAMGREDRIDRQQTGRHWEQVAESFLSRQGLKLLERNFRCRFGEIDLVMNEDVQLVFIEVRYRNSTGKGGGAETVDLRKQQRIIKASAAFLAMHPRYATRICRFDVISIDRVRGHAAIEWIRNAFELPQG